MDICDRIKRIMDEKGLQSSSFAEKIGVSAGAISHILNGRNKPSNDTIEKILKAFPDISSAWLLKGDGPMYKHIHHGSPPFIPQQGGLFDENKAVDLPVKTEVQEYPQEIEVEKPKNKNNSTEIQYIKPVEIPSKKIDKIMIFFNDKTFLTFIPEE